MSLWIITWLVLCSGAKSIKDNHDSDIDYKDALSKGILFFQGQRSGKLPANQQVKWRADSALSDGDVENVRIITKLGFSLQAQGICSFSRGIYF